MMMIKQPLDEAIARPATHVLHWVPPYMTVAGKGRWALQAAARYPADAPVPGWRLNAGRDASQDDLATRAGRQLGYPVTLVTAVATFTTVWPLRLRRREPAYYVCPAVRIDGRAEFITTAYGDSLPGIEASALAEARDLYGPDAELRLEHVGPVHTAFTTDPGRYYARVKVRCTNFYFLSLAGPPGGPEPGPMTGAVPAPPEPACPEAIA
jgi:hypothetical protein